MRGHRLEAIPGAPPDLSDKPTGCSFAPRCRFAQASCTAGIPDLRTTGQGHQVRCVLAEAA
jgi:peptide/nickel transport system ATP-binding protein